MAEKRKDSKGRVLRKGESQRSDGKYMYRYIDQTGKRESVYSWKLVPTDKIQNGQKNGPSLRELEEEIDRAFYSGVKYQDANKISVNDLFDDFMERRTDLATTTRSNYICLYNKHIKNHFGKLKVANVKYTDVQRLYISFIKKYNLKASTVQRINSILSQLFEAAVLDDFIKSNPTDHVLNNLRKTIDFEQEKRHALTEEEQNRLVDYVYSSKKFSKYGCFITVLLGTGLRISELLGLRWCDCDFRKGIIAVTHSLLYKTDEEGNYEYRISKPKTKSGYRSVPMFSEVKEVLLKEKALHKEKNQPAFVVDGYSGFIFLNGNGKVYTPSFIYDTLQRLIVEYNREELYKASAEKREAVFLPKFSAHNLRHTFCTRLCENESNIKIVQDVMGHKNVRTTMDIYNEATESRKRQSFQSLEGKIKLA